MKIKIKFILFLIALFATGGLIRYQLLSQQPHLETSTIISNNSTSNSFILMGDTGSGEDQQFQIANQINNYCHTSKDCQSVFILGDVIYEKGVSNLNDQQFQSKFEIPYQNVDLPFYIGLGNHDYFGCTNCYLEYSSNSSKWKMPSRFYTVNTPYADFIVIDTEKFNQDQQQWLSNQLQDSKSKFRIVLGHRPIKTSESTKIGEKWSGMDRLQQIICQSAQIYVSGHAHILEDQGRIDNCITHQLISGSGGAYPRKVNPKYVNKFYLEDNGFLTISTSETELKYYFIDKLGHQLHNGSIN